MEKGIGLLIPVLMTALLIRLLLLPIRWIWKVAIHAGCGLVCLWLVNGVSGFTGLAIPVNAVTVLTAGFLGLPGMGLLALLEVLG